MSATGYGVSGTSLTTRSYLNFILLVKVFKVVRDFWW